MLHYLYGSKPGVARKLVATFGSDQQLLTYVRWATLSEKDGVCKFEQGSALASFSNWTRSDKLLTEEDPMSVEHNPSPSML